MAIPQIIYILLNKKRRRGSLNFFPGTPAVDREHIGIKSRDLETLLLMVRRSAGDLKVYAEWLEDVRNKDVHGKLTDVHKTVSEIHSRVDKVHRLSLDHQTGMVGMESKLSKIDDILDRLMSMQFSAGLESRNSMFDMLMEHQKGE